MGFAPTALHSIAQGRRDSGAPWVAHTAQDRYPNGVSQIRDRPRGQSVDNGGAAANDEPLVQPRWGNNVGSPCVVRGEAANPGYGAVGVACVCHYAQHSRCLSPSVMQALHGLWLHVP